MSRLTNFANNIPEPLFKLGAAMLLLIIGLKAWFDVDISWDTWAYHLPFAARLWGLVDSTQFVMDIRFAHRFEGLSVFGEYLQGALWALFGRPEAANLVGYASLLLFLFFLHRRYAVPYYLSALTLLAVPLIQAHAATAYIDLPGGLATATAILLVFSMYTEAGATRRSDVILLIVVAACAANIRLNHMPIVALALLIAAPKLLPIFLGQRGSSMGRRALGLGMLGLALGLVFYTPLRNSLEYGNPIYPMPAKIAGVELPHFETMPDEPQIHGLELPRPLRWLFSTLELMPSPLYQGHWSIDQSATGRVGGFLGAYVVVNLALLCYFAWRHRTIETRLALLVILIISLVTSVMPNSARLRYSMYWMIVLVALNLYLVVHMPQLGRLTKAGWQHFLATIAVTVLLVVLVDTRAAFIKPSFYSFEQFKAKVVNPRLIADIQPGERICTNLSHWQYQFAYVDRFNGQKPYSVVQASTVEWCSGARVLQ